MPYFGGPNHNTIICIANFHMLLLVSRVFNPTLMSKLHCRKNYAPPRSYEMELENLVKLDSCILSVVKKTLPF